MSALPLSHHEILERVAPFTRRGRHVDLAASDRLERRLRFRPVDRAGPAEQADTTPTLIETLDPQHQFRAGAGYVIARDYTLDSGSGDAAALLSHGVVQVGALLLTLLALLGVVVSMAHYGLGRQSGLWILFFQLPTALIALSFCLQELAQYEIPPWPRRAPATQWRR